MMKYAILAVIVALAVGTIYVMQQKATQPVVEQATRESVTPRSGGNSGQAVSYAGEVLETMDAGGYTYVHVNTGTEKIWAAGPQTVIKVGDKVNFVGGMEMRGFRSETLDRNFDSIQFVPAINTGENTAVVPEGHPQIQSSPDASEMDFSGVQVPDGGKSIAQVYEQRASLVGKEVTIRGKVVKFTAGVMGKNWIHLMDGTGNAGANDLTVTTDGVVTIGDVITIRGQVGTDKDFGYGYKYDVIVENAVVTVDT